MEEEAALDINDHLCCNCCVQPTSDADAQMDPRQYDDLDVLVSGRFASLTPSCSLNRLNLLNDTRPRGEWKLAAHSPDVISVADRVKRSLTHIHECL